MPRLYNLKRMNNLGIVSAMRHLEHIEIRRTLKGPSSFVPYENIATAILGNQYNLSLTICGDTLARRVNKQHRNKAYSPNVLSFPYDKHSGEIFLNLRKAAREARKYPSIVNADGDRSISEHSLFLFIHGCLHLKGLDHGKKMDALEIEYVKQYIKAKK